MLQNVVKSLTNMNYYIQECNKAINSCRTKTCLLLVNDGSNPLLLKHCSKQWRNHLSLVLKLQQRGGKSCCYCDYVKSGVGWCGTAAPYLILISTIKTTASLMSSDHLSPTVKLKNTDVERVGCDLSGTVCKCVLCVRTVDMLSGPPDRERVCLQKQ